jgi:uncharacterized protein (DUF302 family)
MPRKVRRASHELLQSTFRGQGGSLSAGRMGGAQVMADPAGLITRASPYDWAETARRLRAAVADAGLTVFAEIDHAKGAQEIASPLRPTLLLIFGNARGGTPLMLKQQTTGLDLPLKALIWEDEDGAAWVTYNEPRWIAERHGLGPDAAAGLSAGLEKLVGRATS